MVRRFYRRRSRRYSRRLKTIKWSVENTIFEGGLQPQQQANIIVVPSTTVLGVRKVKNFTLTLDGNHPYAFVLAFVPEGTNPGNVVVGNGQVNSLYEPNQNVISKGYVQGGLPQNFFSRLSRNLNSGDAIYLCVLNLVNQATDFQVSLSYAISFN